MSLQQAIKLLQSFPSHLQSEVVNFVEFLAQKYSTPTSGSVGEIRRAHRGRWAGKVYMASDFDDPIEGFEAENTPKREWNLLGSANLSGQLDRTNVQDFAHE